MSRFWQRFWYSLIFLLWGVVAIIWVMLSAPPKAPPPPPQPLPLAQASDIARAEVLPDRKVRFTFNAPKASQVTAYGEWLKNIDKKELLLTRDDKGIWSAEIGPLPPGIYNYQFGVDGIPVAVRDINNSAAFGSNFNDLFKIPGENFDEVRNVPHGQTHIVWYQSPTRNAIVSAYVYTPPGYESNSKRYPVLYLLHGGTDLGMGWSTMGRANFILDNLLSEGKAQPMIIVMPLGNNIREEVMQEVLPYVEQHFRIISDREHRAIAGTSWGGGETLRIFTSNLDKFAYAGVWQAGVGEKETPSFEQRQGRFLNDPAVNQKVRLFSIMVSDKDSLAWNARNLSTILKRHNVKHEIVINSGGHTWHNGRQYLNAFLPRLFTEAVK